jgi:hypothetical protein
MRGGPSSRRSRSTAIPGDEADLFRGDQWDQVVLDPDSRLVPSVVGVKRIAENAVLLLEKVKRQLSGAAPETITSDQYPVFAAAALAVFGREVASPRPSRPGRPKGCPTPRSTRPG